MGWAMPKLVEDDLGISASGFADRPGFQWMLGQVTLRKVGIIFCIEASRLSRNSPDWAHLFELCGYFDTLIADVQQVYDVSAHCLRNCGTRRAFGSSRWLIATR